VSALFASIPFAIIATGALVGVAASLLGTFLILRGDAMLTDAIGHSIVLGIVLVWLATGQASGPVQIVGAAVTGLATVVATEALARTRRMGGDAAIGLVFPALFSIGVLLLNLYARDVHIDAHTVLLGEIGFVWLDVVPVFGVDVPDALLWMAVVTAANLAFVVTLYKELKIATFDRGLAAALGFAPGLLGYALLGLTSATAVAAFDSVGVVLFLAFAILPPAAAYLLTDRLALILAYAAGFSVAASVLGYLLAVAWDVSIGGTMALVAAAILAASFLASPRYGLVAQEVRRRGQVEANENRALTVHLFQHERGPEAGEENVLSALRTHLRWGDAKARAVVARCLDARLVERSGQQLLLTNAGRATAREILEPAGRRAGAGG